jgi:MoaA/NifB/PqqE/SkfB family radical SAM enzyme
MNMQIEYQKKIAREQKYRRVYSSLVNTAIVASRIKVLREAMLAMLVPVVEKSILISQGKIVNKRILKDKTDMMMAVIYSALRTNIHKKTLQILMKDVFLNQEAKSKEYKFQTKHGFIPPGFINIAPGKQCNLKCLHCYANASTDKEKLSYKVFSRIIKEAKDNWGTHFFVITGGEPFLWKDEGYTLLDIAERNQDCLFLVYTNGTLLHGDNLKRVSKLCNILPAISVEGMEEATDARRGKGLFKKIVKVMNNLRNKDIAFGISVTATTENYREILSDEFIDYFFKKLGASFGWLFHYMPIGRAPNPSLMPTPEQRLWMWHRSWDIVRKEKIMLGDFWNHGTVSNGCISAAKPGGYFYIDWNGNIIPCAFFPYSTININDIYEDGKTINAIFDDPFLKAIRSWQQNYGCLNAKLNAETDWLRPCPMRDHYTTAQEVVNKYHARLIDGNDPVMRSKRYANEMMEFDRNLKEKVGTFWCEEYIKNGQPSCNQS